MTIFFSNKEKIHFNTVKTVCCGAIKKYCSDLVKITETFRDRVKCWNGMLELKASMLLTTADITCQTVADMLPVESRLAVPPLGFDDIGIQFSYIYPARACSSRGYVISVGVHFYILYVLKIYIIYM